jgi:hypothetical protein
MTIDIVVKIEISGEKRQAYSFVRNAEKEMENEENEEKMDIEHSWLERTNRCKDSIPTIRNKYSKK